MLFTLNSIRKIKFLVLTLALSFFSFSNTLAFTIGNNISFGSELGLHPKNISTIDFFVPRISLIKTGVTVDATGSPGNGCDSILFTYEVTNESDSGEILENVVLTDPLLGGIIAGPLSGDDNNNTFIDPGETWIYEAGYIITQADIDAGFVDGQANVDADVQGQPGVTVQDISDNDSPNEDDDTIISLVHCQPNIAVIKTGTPMDATGGPGCDFIQYTFEVTNESILSVLENVVLNDELLGGNIPGPDSGDLNNDTFLDPDETWIYTAQYIIMPDDINTGQVDNQATVTADVQGQGTTVEDDSDDDSILENDLTVVSLAICANPDIAMIKEGSQYDADADGCIDSILYTFTVTNTGDVDLVEILVEDPLFNGEIPGPVNGSDNGEDGILSIGETWTYQAIYAITQQDIDNAAIVNQATVTALTLSDVPVSDLSDDDSLLEDDPTRTAVPDDACTEGSASIGLIKEGIVVDIDGNGCMDNILYTFTLTNTGDVDIDEITLEDELLEGEVPGPVNGSDDGDDGILSVGETWTYEALYEITQQDIDNAAVVNQAIVNGEIVGTDVPVSDLSDDDSLFEDEPTRTAVPDDACTEGSASIGLIKEGVVVDVDGDGCLDSILYTFTLTNTGDVDIDEITLEDELLGGEVPGPMDGSDDNNDGILSVGETWTYEALYEITQQDIDNAAVGNQAIVNGEILGTDVPISDLSDDDSLFEDEPTRTAVPDDACTEGSADMGLIKEGTVIDIDVDGCMDSILYTFTLTNTGDVDIDEITLEDELLDGEVPGPVNGSDDDDDGILSVGETWIYEALYAITQEDIDNAVVVNQATVNGEFVGADVPVSDLSDNTSLDGNAPTRTIVPDDACAESSGEARIGMIKTGILSDNNGDLCDDIIRYIFTVTNIGDVDLDNVIIEDELVNNNIQGPLNDTDINDDGVLSVGESWDYEAIYIIQQTDIDEGFVENQANVVANLSGFNIQIMDLSDHTDLAEDNPTTIVVPNNTCTDGGSPASFEIFNGITPNGDGLNDYFRILGIENYPDNNVKIFNRWGVQVYEINGYGQGNNLFYGISEGRATLQQDRELASGTYFYILTFTGEDNPGEESYSGYLYINRN
ncbi:MAG: gliding motility-associated C-terminal domain-containing protein [Flagellimonas sp.]